MDTYFGPVCRNTSCAFARQGIRCASFPLVNGSGRAFTLDSVFAVILLCLKVRGDFYEGELQET